MYAVDVYAAVRRFIFVEGKSRREAARVFGLSRDVRSLDSEDLSIVQTFAMK